MALLARMVASAAVSKEDGVRDQCASICKNSDPRAGRVPYFENRIKTKSMAAKLRHHGSGGLSIAKAMASVTPQCPAFALEDAAWILPKLIVKIDTDMDDRGACIRALQSATANVVKNRFDLTGMNSYASKVRGAKSRAIGWGEYKQDKLHGKLIKGLSSTKTASGVQQNFKYFAEQIGLQVDYSKFDWFENVTLSLVYNPTAFSCLVSHLLTIVNGDPDFTMTDTVLAAAGIVFAESLYQPAGANVLHVTQQA